MKKYAWTLAELMMALVFIMVISGFLISNFKPATQNAKIGIYAAIRNIEKGIIAIDDKYEKAMQKCASCNKEDCTAVCGNDGGKSLRKTIFESANGVENTERFCQELADTMSLKSSDCRATGATANLVLPNGVEVYGLRSTIQHLDKSSDEGKKYAFLDIGIDLDGKKGVNRIGVDRFPLRIFAVDNIVLPVDCTTTKIYDWRQYGNGKDGMITIPVNPYCKKGKNFDGQNSNVNFQTNPELITYDTFVNNRKDNSNVNKQDTLVAGGYSRPFAATVCGNYNTVKPIAGVNTRMNRFYSPTECSTAGFTIFTECNKTDKDAICYYVLHRPSAGMSAIVQGMVGSDLDMD